MTELFFLIGAVLVALAVWWPLNAYARAGDALPKATKPMIVASLAAAAIVGMYFVVGSPGLPGGSQAERLRALAARNPETFTPMEMTAVLEDAAKRHPNDARPLIFLGRIEASMGRAEPAQRALEEALRRDPNSVEAMIELGRVLVAAAQGEVTADARALFEEAGARAPNEFLPVFYQALAARQEGRSADARRLWEAAQARLAENDPRREMVRQMLAEGAQR
ncbi:MAG: hypothetical protein JNJ73_00185 [Hyphomonadaceae bacterium]|nr:hypothetical protein [Hyphomonadaceae bacterium]